MMRVVLLVSLIFICATHPSFATDDRKHAFNAFAEIYKEDFCYLQEQISHSKLTRTCNRLNQNYLKFFFSLFVMLGWGAAVRTVIRTFKINIPYTVVLMASGLLIGLGSRINSSICETWTIFTKIARTPPEIILYVFLPVLIFESAFKMKAHVFMRSLMQILVLALPGMLISTFITAAACRQIMQAYDWTFSQAAMFGSIISATDPVAVVAILGDLGTSEMLSVMVEGESLLNDGVAILLYDIFKDMVEEPDNKEDQLRKILLTFMKIALGGPVFGWVMAKLAIFFLSQIFNDAATEITITLVAAYLTYFIGEHFLGVSGVMAVVILGITMSAESTCISPEVQGTVHHFWEMLGYLANTILFVLVGIVITETAINSFQVEDGWYVLSLYVILTVIRLLMLVVLSPILARIGYGITWQNLLVMTWGGLRGAVGICLALEVYKNKFLCDLPQIGPKFLLQTAGIVILTLAVNGTTTKMVLDALKVTKLSVGKLQDMANAVKQIQSARQRTLTSLLRDRFLADANWDIVQDYTTISNPYQHNQPNRFKHTVKEIIAHKFQSLALGHGSTLLEPDPEPSPEEYRAMTEEARLRLLKAIKISCWRQFEKGILSEEAVQTLVGVVEFTEDKELSMVHVRDMKKYWKIRGLAPKLRKIASSVTVESGVVLPKPPKQKWRKRFYDVVTKPWFEYVMYFIVLLNMIPVGYEIYILAAGMSTDDIGASKWFSFASALFSIVYLLEFVVKVIGLRWRNYFRDPWNWLDFFVLLISLAELPISLLIVYSGPSGKSERLTEGEKYVNILKNVRLLRITRTFRWGRAAFPLIVKMVDNRINAQLFLGYDIGKGFVRAIDDAMKFLPQMMEEPKIREKFRFVLEQERLDAVREMGLLQREHPGVTIGVKTRHASRAVLNEMRDNLKTLKEDGLLDDKEFNILMLIIEENMKRLWVSPASISPTSSESLLSNVSWIMGSEEIQNYVTEHVVMLHYAQGDVVCETGEPSDGIYLVINGLIRITYEVDDEIAKAMEKRGKIPNTEVVADLSYRAESDDYFSTGMVIGEIGVLTEQARASSVICETPVTMYHLSQDCMLAALQKFQHPYNSLQSRMWRSVGMKIAAEYLPTQSAFYSWTADKIKAFLERGTVPVGNQFATMHIPEFVSHTILFNGQLMNTDTKTIYTAPYLIPPNCTKINRYENSNLEPFFLIIADDELFPQTNDHGSSTSLQNCIMATMYSTQGRTEEFNNYMNSHFTSRTRAEAERDKTGLSKTINEKAFYRKVSGYLYSTLMLLLGSSVTKAEEVENYLERNMSILSHHMKSHPEDFDEMAEFREFCHEQEEVRMHPEQAIENCSEPVPGEFTENDLLILFSLAVIILYGAVVRTVLRRFKLNIPYTVILMVSGLIVGLISKYNCRTLHIYTAIARIKPEIILYAFLPILVFESSFSISSHLFVKMSAQLLVISFPGMIITTFLTAGSCMYFLPGYKWSFVDASLFGSIISATDPVAVVAILRELGTSETLGVMIEGESLLNDGVAVLLYEIFEEIVEDSDQELLSDPKRLIGHVAVKFLQIAVGGPIFGFVVGKIAIFCLGRIFNDSTAETTITIVAAYLTYYIGEDLLGVSGIMAVVILGITMGSERTSISPESEIHIHHFWEMLGYLANTLLFVIVGIVITEIALTDIDLMDLGYVVNLYVLLTFIRLFMIVILSPIINRVGHPIVDWKNTCVMSWGGLRGAVGLCLALEVFNNPHLCSRNELGPKILFQTAGIVFLTLVINGTTTKKLMQILGMTKIVPARMDEMRYAMTQILKTRATTISVLKQDRFLAQTDWDAVEQYTMMTNTYNVKLPVILESSKMASLLAVKFSKYIEFMNQGINTDANPWEQEHSRLTLEKYKEMTMDARSRVLTTLRISYWRQHEQGLIKETATQILVENCDRIKHKEFAMVEAKYIQKFFVIKGVTAWVQRNIVHKLGLDNIETHPPMPKQNWRYGFWWLSTRQWLDSLLIVIVILNLIPIIWEFVLEAEYPGSCFEHRNAFTIANFIFTFIYLLEFFCKLIGFGWTGYWGNHWNFVDAIVLVISIIDTIFSALPCDKDNIAFEFFGIVKVLRLFRISRGLLLLQPILPHIINVVNRRINDQLFLAYDIGKGFVIGIEDVLKLLPRMSESTVILNKLKTVLEKERVVIVRQMGLLQKDHPGIAVSVKTRHASRAVLNQMKQMLSELKKDGLVDDKTGNLLSMSVEEKIKRLNNFPSVVPIPSFFSILENVSWLHEDEKAINYFKSIACLRTFVSGDKIYENGQVSHGVYIVLTGLVKIDFFPSKKITDELLQFGVIPNTEVFGDMCFNTRCFDYFGPGTIIGELGVLKQQERAATVIADTFVSAYHISHENMRIALKTFNDPYDSLHARIWHSLGKKLASALLRRQYQNWSSDAIQVYLENSAIPLWDGNFMSSIEIPNYIADVIVVEGYVMNYHSKETYIAPCVVSKICTQMLWQNNPLTVNRILVIAHEDIEDDAMIASQTEQTPSNDLRTLDGFVKTYSIEKENIERIDIRQRRLSIAIKYARRTRDEMNRKMSSTSSTLISKQDTEKV